MENIWVYQNYRRPKIDLGSWLITDVGILDISVASTLKRTYMELVLLPSIQMLNNSICILLDAHTHTAKYKDRMAKASLKYSKPCLI